MVGAESMMIDANVYFVYQCENPKGAWQSNWKTARSFTSLAMTTFIKAIGRKL